MSTKYEVMEEKARVGQIIHNGSLEYFVLAINGNSTLLQCISENPDSFKNGEIVIASGLKKYKITIDNRCHTYEWQWNSGTYLSNAFIGNVLKDLIEPENSKENRLKVLLYNAIVLLEENNCYEGTDNLLDNLGMTEEEYKEIMED